jgi:hypothetical protein
LRINIALLFGYGILKRGCIWFPMVGSPSHIVMPRPGCRPHSAPSMAESSTSVCVCPICKIQQTRNLARHNVRQSAGPALDRLGNLAIVSILFIAFATLAQQLLRSDT